MQHSFNAACRHVRVRPLLERDIEKIRQWRNEESLSRFLRPIGQVTPQMQQKWFASYLIDPDQMMFAIEELTEGGRLVGSLALYNIEGDSAEIGKIVVGEPTAHGKKIGFYSFLLVMHIGFSCLNVAEFSLDVHEDNLVAKKIYSQLGFCEKGRHPFVNGGQELEMILSKEQFLKLHADLLAEIKIGECK